MLFISGLLMAVTAGAHGVGIAVLVKALRRWHATPPTRLWPITWLLVYIMWWLVLLHVTAILIWAAFYVWSGCLPDAETAIYFSGVTYTTMGYGDVVLAEPWRVIAPIEGLTGVLMCGLSAGVFFAVVSRIHQAVHPPAEPRR